MGQVGSPASSRWLVTAMPPSPGLADPWVGFASARFAAQCSVRCPAGREVLAGRRAQGFPLRAAKEADEDKRGAM